MTAESNPRFDGYVVGKWPDDGATPTKRDFTSHYFLDFSKPDNVRKVARMIAIQNDMETAASLTGELSYAYRDSIYDVASMAESLTGIASQHEYEAIIEALEEIDGPDTSSSLLQHLIGAVEVARDKSP